MGRIVVRKGREGDHVLFADYQVRMAEETEGRKLDRARVERGCQHMLATPTLGFYMVAEVDGEPAGMLALTFEWSDWRNGVFWWIQDVFVDEKYRKQGVFRALFEKVRADAMEDPGVCGIRLYHEVENESAHAVYVQCGLKDCEYDMMEIDFQKAQ